VQKRDWWAAGVAAGVLVVVGALVSSRGAASSDAQEEGAVQEAAAEKAIQIRSQLHGTNVILFLVEDGKKVKKGELLVELDDSALRDELTRLKMEVERAKSQLTMAAIRRDVEQRRSAAQASGDQVEIARLRLEQGQAQLRFDERVIEQEMEVAAHARELAQSRHARAAELAKANQVPANEVEEAQLDLLKADAALEQAKGKRELLVKYTQPLREAELKRDIARAQAERDVVRREAEVAIVQSAAEQHAAEADFRVAQERPVSRAVRSMPPNRAPCATTAPANLDQRR
jgi:HlyD family secretion protein